MGNGLFGGKDNDKENAILSSLSTLSTSIKKLVDSYNNNLVPTVNSVSAYVSGLAKGVQNQVQQKQLDELESRLSMKLANVETKVIENLSQLSGYQDIVADREALKQKVAELETNLQKKDEKIDVLNKQLSDQVTRIAERIKTNEENASKVQKQAEEIETKNGEIESLKKEVDERDRKIKEHETEIANLKTKNETDQQAHDEALKKKNDEHVVEMGKLKAENETALAQAQQDANGRVDAVKQSFKSFRLEEAAETLGLNIENGCDDHTRQLINIYLWFISERVNDEASAEFVRRFTALDQTISACYQKNGDQLADMRAKMQEVINKRNEDQGSRIRIEWPSEGEKYDDMKHTRKNDSGLTIESVSSAYIYSLKPDGSQECLCTASVTTQR